MQPELQNAIRKDDYDLFSKAHKHRQVTPDVISSICKQLSVNIICALVKNLSFTCKKAQCAFVASLLDRTIRENKAVKKSPDFLKKLETLVFAIADLKQFHLLPVLENFLHSLSGHLEGKFIAANISATCFQKLARLKESHNVATTPEEPANNSVLDQIKLLSEAKLNYQQWQKTKTHHCTNFSSDRCYHLRERLEHLIEDMLASQITDRETHQQTYLCA